MTLTLYEQWLHKNGQQKICWNFMYAADRVWLSKTQKKKRRDVKLFSNDIFCFLVWCFELYTFEFIIFNLLR